MGAKEMIIRFISVFSRTGEPPEAEMKALADTTTAAASATDKLSTAASKSNPVINRTEKEIADATRAAWAMRMAANGSTEGLKGLSNVAASLGSTLGSMVARVTMLGAAFTAGWKVGSIIREQLIDPLLAADRNVVALKDSVTAIEREFGKLSSSQIDGYIANLKALVEDSERVIVNMQRADAQELEIRQSRDRARSSGIEADVAESPERAKQLAQERTDAAVRDLAKKRVAAYSNISEGKLDVESADMELASAKNVRDAAASRFQAADARRRDLGGSGDQGDNIDLIRSARVAQDNLMQAEKKLAEAMAARAEVVKKVASDEIEQQKVIEVATNDITTAENIGRAAVAKADAEIAQRSRDTTVAMPEGGNAAIREGIAARQTRLAQSGVMALTREDDGTVTPRGGRATQQAGQQALAEAGRRVAAGEDEAQVLIDLAAKLREQSVVYKGGFAALSAAVDSMDGEQGTIKARLAKLEAQGKSARGLD